MYLFVELIMKSRIHRDIGAPLWVCPLTSFSFLGEQNTILLPVYASHSHTPMLL
jgi:hypothetical protein